MFSILVFFSCELDSSNQQSDPSSTTVPAQVPGSSEKKSAEDKVMQSMASVEIAAQNLSTSTFDKQMEEAKANEADWIKSPILTALKFTGERMDSRNLNIDVKSLTGGESITKVLVTIIQDGFMDDSVSGDVTFLRMAKVAGTWEIVSAKKAWKCWKNRGHEDYSTEPCG